MRLRHLYVTAQLGSIFAPSAGPTPNSQDASHLHLPDMETQLFISWTTSCLTTSPGHLEPTVSSLAVPQEPGHHHRPCPSMKVCSNLPAWLGFCHNGQVVTDQNLRHQHVPRGFVVAPAIDAWREPPTCRQNSRYLLLTTPRGEMMLAFPAQCLFDLINRLLQPIRHAGNAALCRSRLGAS